MEADDDADGDDDDVAVIVAAEATAAGALKLIAVEWVDDTCMIPRGAVGVAVGDGRSCLWVIASDDCVSYWAIGLVMAIG